MKYKKGIVLTFATLLIASISLNVYFSGKIGLLQEMLIEQDSLLKEISRLSQENANKNGVSITDDEMTNSISTDTNNKKNIELGVEYLAGVDLAPGLYRLYLRSSDNQSFKITIRKNGNECQEPEERTGQNEFEKLIVLEEGFVFSVTGTTEEQYMIFDGTDIPDILKTTC